MFTTIALLPFLLQGIAAALAAFVAASFSTSYS